VQEAFEMARLFVAIATIGRAELVRRTVDLLADQTRVADGILVTTVTPADAAGVEQARGRPEIVFGERGLCRQRNRALRALAGRADITIFLDDDFVAAPDFLANIERLFEEMPDVVGITGDLIADGIHGDGYSIEQAQALIAERTRLVHLPWNRHSREGGNPFPSAAPGAKVRKWIPAFAGMTKGIPDKSDGAPGTQIRPRKALYGCNMAIRMEAAAGLSFDEALPLYGWQEDIDFTYQLGRRGRLISTGLVTGVHLGAKGGRSSGKRIGYSQVANIVYLWRKGTMEPGLGERLMRQNLLSNLARSVWPEPHIDRRGRLIGNMLALKDWATGRIDPRRIETM
jgi:hypothetical protein